MKCFTVAFLALCCHLVAVRAEDPKDGMGCKTEGGFEFCEGASKTYSTMVGQADAGSGGLETRSFSPGGGSTYGFEPKQLCDWNDQEKCQQLSVITKPTFMKNARNQPRYILQSKGRQQKVQLAICSNNKCGRGRCDQQYASVQLLASDPFARKPRWEVDTFRIPSCCKCANMKFPGRNYK